MQSGSATCVALPEISLGSCFKLAHLIGSDCFYGPFYNNGQLWQAVIRQKTINETGRTHRWRRIVLHASACLDTVLKKHAVITQTRMHVCARTRAHIGCGHETKAVKTKAEAL